MRAGNPSFVHGCVSAFVLLENVLGGKGKCRTLQAVVPRSLFKVGASIAKVFRIK